LWLLSTSVCDVVVVGLRLGASVVVALAVPSLVVIVESRALGLLLASVCDVVVVGPRLGASVAVALAVPSLVVVVESGALGLLLASVCEVAAVGPELGASEVPTQVVVVVETAATVVAVAAAAVVAVAVVAAVVAAVAVAVAFFVAGVAGAGAVIGLLVSLCGHGLRAAEAATCGLRGATACQEAGGGRSDMLGWGNGGVACFEGPLRPVSR
jgi:hypothetical protein